MAGRISGFGFLISFLEIFDFRFSIFDWELPLRRVFGVSIFVPRGSAQSKIENRKSKM